VISSLEEEEESKAIAAECYCVLKTSVNQRFTLVPGPVQLLLITADMC
jgi:hypothetical protein